MPAKGFWRYENGLLAMLTVSLGFTILDRVSLTILAPFILADLHLGYTDLSLMAGALSVTLAISGYVFGRYSDRWRNRRLCLGVSVLLFSVFSSITGLAVSLWTMIAARLVMGLTEGPILPLSYSIMALESSPRRRSFNHGVLANFATCLLGGVVGPVVLTQLASAYSWRIAFFLSGLPGLAIALLLLRFMREPATAAAPRPHEGTEAEPPRENRRNLLLCTLLLCGLYAWLLLTLDFLPSYLVHVVGLSPTQMGWMLAIFGVSGCTTAIFVSWLADRIGRKPTVILFGLVGLLVPVGALAGHQSVWTIAACLFVGWSFIGCSPLLAGTIPSESADPARLSRTLAMIIGVSEVVAGVILPVIGGAAADRWGLAAPMWIVLGTTALTVVGACFLVETLPARATLPDGVVPLPAAPAA